MNVLLIGSGGREHAIAWKAAQSPQLTKLFAIPGNPGLAQLAECVPLKVNDHAAVTDFCKEKGIDLVIVGPETPLADGLADALLEMGIRCFGPRRAAARIESSKSFAKDFMQRHRIPTAGYARFVDYPAAIDYLLSIPGGPGSIVIKASGLAAGKGVILPETLEEAVSALEMIMVRQEFGPAGAEVVIEERLSGPEVSLMAFTDGVTVVPMIPAQDHKRLLDGDCGPNTGGMGAYAPAPVCPPGMVADVLKTILQPTVDGLHQEGIPFAGVLYAGLMLTADGPRVLEFNCRFGDPETQVVLPLLETDLIEIALACCEGRLEKVDVRWKNASAVCVVLAGRGYPGKAEAGTPVVMGSLPENTICFHAGTRLENGRLVTSGGRVVGVTAWAPSLPAAVEGAYQAVAAVRFEGMQWRRDIAGRALDVQEWQPHPLTGKGGLPVPPIRLSASRQQSVPRSAYASSGVSIDAGNRAVELMRDAVRATYTPAVLAGIGSFGGLYDASALKALNCPVLVASTDGVGTKVKLAAQAGRYRSLGHDIVNHCIDDILVQGARPLFFMDYFATSKLVPEQTAEVVTGIAEACKQAGMVLLGGETAEMPGVYAPQEFDLAGTIVGVLERDAILPRTSELKAGDVLIGLSSSGPHTNGYSLIRRVFADTPLEMVFPELGLPLADALLAPHRSYLNLLWPLIGSPPSGLKALAHLTGGGFIENIPRVLPEHLDAEIHLGSWPLPPLWPLIQEKGNIPAEEMYRVFNMGIGMLAIVEETGVAQFQASVPEPVFVIGRLVEGQGRTRLCR